MLTDEAGSVAETHPLVASPGSFDLVEEETIMAAVCEVCGKGPSWGMNVSHSHRRTKRRWNPNIQRVKALIGSTPKRMYVCTGCIKSGKIVKAG